MRNYIYIFEDNTLLHTKGYSESDLLACEDGIITIIDITDPENPLTYWNGDWDQIQMVEVVSEEDHELENVE